MYFEPGPDGFPKFGIDPNDIEYLLGVIKAWVKENNDIDYRLSTVEAIYAKGDLNWLEIKTSKGGSFAESVGLLKG